MRNLFFTFGLASILATSIYADEQQNSAKFGLYCSDAQVNKILPKTFNVPADNAQQVMIYSPSDVKNNKKTKMAEVWLTYFNYPEGHNQAQQAGMGDVGYMRMLYRFDYANNKEKRLTTATYTCEGNLLYSGVERDWQYTIPGSMSEAVVQDMKAKKIIE